MSLFTNSKRFLFVTGALLGLAFSCLNAAAQPLVQPVTLTYDGLGVGNNIPIPDPYPGLTPATVTHYGVEGGAIALAFQDTYFWGGVAAGDHYGDLFNVAFGPPATPSAFGLDDPAYGVIRITPNYPGTFVRILSLDIAKFAGLAAVERSDAFVLDSELNFYGGQFDFEVSGADNASHTHITFGGLEGPPDRTMMIWWRANNGHVAVDNIMFEIVGAAPELLARNDFYSVAQGGNLALAAPGVMGNDLLRTATGPLTASLLVGATKGNLNLANNGGFSYTSTSSTGMDGFAYQASDTASHSSSGVALISVLPPGALFYDDFARPAGFAVLTPWLVRNGTWTIATGVLSGVAGTSGHADLYVNNNWTDYSVDVTASVAADGYGWAVGGRLNPDIGSLYEVFLYANTAPGAQWRLHLTKHTGWAWDGAFFASDVDVPVVAGSPESTAPHTIRMSFQGNRIRVYFDDLVNPYMDVTDTDPTALSRSSGGIKVGMYSLNSAPFRVEDVTVRQLGDATPPTITSATAVNGTTVQVLFSEPVALASAQTLANYSINNGVTISAAVLGADTRTVTLTTSALATGNYILTVNNVTDRATVPNPIAPNSQAPFSFTADTTRPTITSVTAVNATTVEVLFSEPVALASAQTLANYGINNGVTISAAVLGGDTRTVTLTTSVLVTGNYILTVNNVTDRATPANPILSNTQVAFSFTPPDTTRPTITSVTALNATTVQVLFSEPVALASAQTLANYSINNGVTISAAVLGGDTRTVTLTTSALVTGNYILTVNNVTDQATVPNPILPNTQAPFSFSSAPVSPVFNAAASAMDVDGDASGSLVFAQGALTDGYVVVGVSMWDPEQSVSITAATYDGASMTFLGKAQSASVYAEVYLFGLAVGNKASGNYTLTVAASAGVQQLVFGVASFSGVHQTTPTGPFASAFGTFASATPSTTSPSVLVGSAAGDVVVDILGHDDGNSILGAGQTQNWRVEDSTALADGVSSREAATGSTTTMSHALNFDGVEWALGAVALKGAGPPPPDTTRPTITSVTAVNGTTVQVLFSEPVALASAQTLANYSINSGVTISAAVLGGDTRTVTLTTSTLVAGNYLLTVNNVTDLATVPNPILPNTQAAFSFSLSPVFNTATSAVDVDGNASASLTFSQGALTDGYVVVGVSMWSPLVGASVTGVTYDGTAMTLLGTIQDADAYSEAYLFGLAVGNKAAGNYNVALTGSTGIPQLAFGVSAFSGVSQTTPTGPVASTTGSSTTASVAVSSVTGDVVVDIISQDDGTSTLGAGQTQNWRQEDGTDRADGVSSRETATGATTTMSYVESVASTWSLVAVALKGSGPPPPDVTRPTITSVTAVNATTVQVLFSEPVALASAQTLANYGINNGVTISAAVLGGDTRTVTLTTSTLVAGNYLLTVNNVTDRATVPNPILPNSQAPFSFTLSPVFSTAASAVDTDGNASASLTFAQGALTGGYIVVGVSMWSPVVADSITGVTYDGTAMTLLGTTQSANAYTEVYLFGLAVGSKAAGNYNVALTGSSDIPQLAFGVSAFSGVSQTSPTGAFASATGWSTSPSVSVSSVAGNVVVDILSHDTGTSSVGANQTQNWKQEDSTDRTDGVSSRETATGAATTMSQTKTVSAPWSIGAVALRP